MFRGRSKHTLDDKGRLAIPSRFKEMLDRRGDDSLVLTNHERCLWAFTREDWKVIEEEAIRLPRFDRDVNTYMRYFISGALECPIKQKRIMIPLELRESAGLKKEVVLVGQLDRFEIWDKEMWDEEFQRARTNFSAASQTLAQKVS